ncbi:hypothetical protein [Pontibacter mangrovi]|uniref:Uncharacterized protein n=1 Tax=Pontibacter mangrovi TaxID=2589816 RepID=A0A501W2G4_9BACT|nr:hypothetical protein [Pontibacter mangrovi]TPE42470.1 hypothetical protein FJM65_17845 [Pontibacter mangrovi]
MKKPKMQQGYQNPEARTIQDSARRAFPALPIDKEKKHLYNRGEVKDPDDRIYLSNACFVAVRFGKGCQHINQVHTQQDGRH